MESQAVRRVHLLLGLNQRRKARRRVPQRVKNPLTQPSAFLEMWSFDFINDVLTNQRKFRTLNIIDDFNREAIVIEIAHSMPAIRVTALMEQIIDEHGKSKCIRVDNGPEFISKDFTLGARAKVSKFSIPSLVDPCKMDISNVSTEALEKVSWMPTYLKI